MSWVNFNPEINLGHIGTVIIFAVASVRASRKWFARFAAALKVAESVTKAQAEITKRQEEIGTIVGRLQADVNVLTLGLGDLRQDVSEFQRELKSHRQSVARQIDGTRTQLEQQLRENRKHTEELHVLIREMSDRIERAVESVGTKVENGNGKH